MLNSASPVTRHPLRPLDNSGMADVIAETQLGELR